LSEAKAYKSK